MKFDNYLFVGYGFGETYHFTMPDDPKTLCGLDLISGRHCYYPTQRMASIYPHTRPCKTCKKASGEKKHKVQSSLTKEELASLKIIARKRNVSISGTVRLLIVEEIERENLNLIEPEHVRRKERHLRYERIQAGQNG